MSDPTKPVCGIVMPISAIDDCNEVHWSDVQEILSEAIDKAGFVANLVSNADDVGIIHKRIIQNLYDNPIVVVDVSGKNPNVMFELGMRLAFDKPTIIIKDDRTKYSFDTSPIEHLEYPRDLRFGKIVEFKNKLAEKITATHLRSTSDKEYTPFLKHFGEFVVAKIDKKEVSGQEFILAELKSLRMLMQSFAQNRSGVVINRTNRLDLCMGGWPDELIESSRKKLIKFPGVLDVRVRERSPNHKHLYARLDDGTELSPEAAYDFLGLPVRNRRDPIRSSDRSEKD